MRFLALLLLLFPLAGITCPICSYDKQAGGRCIDVGGYQLYAQRLGTTGPNIIMEAGLGDSSTEWDKVAPQVAKFARVLVYDRNGLGKSQIKPHENNVPRTAQQVVDNLKILLNKMQIKPPYYLVGHSMGGVYLQLYARQNPQDVAGVVLVDAATPEQKGDDPLPPQDARYYLEAKGIKTSLEQVRAAPAFPAVPIIILATAQKGSGWLEMQQHLTTLSNQHQFITTADSGHYIQREQPELVINAIKNLIEKSNQK